MILLWAIQAVSDGPTNAAAAPPLPPPLNSRFHSNRLANCISYHLIALLSRQPSGKPGPTTMRRLLLEEPVFNHFCYSPIVLLTVHK